MKRFVFPPVVPQLSFQVKVGVMYCRAGQSTEEEMYNNETAGPALEEFLELLGEKVRLKGFTKYRAQLDTKSNNQKHSTHLRITFSGRDVSLKHPFIVIISCLAIEGCRCHTLLLVMFIYGSS